MARSRACPTARRAGGKRATNTRGGKIPKWRRRYAYVEHVTQQAPPRRVRRVTLHETTAPNGPEKKKWRQRGESSIALGKRKKGGVYADGVDDDGSHQGRRGGLEHPLKQIEVLLEVIPNHLGACGGMRQHAIGEVK